MGNAIGVKSLINRNYKTLDFDGVWLDLIGTPELKGSWIIWGKSFNGKTSLAMQLAKYLCKFGKIYYNSLEEGDCESVKQTYTDFNMEEVSGKFMLLDREPMDELKSRLKLKNSPKIVVIDSLQYTYLTLKEYKDFVSEFPNKLFLWTSHADGKHPQGTLAKAVRYDAFVKIWVQGYMAFVQSRYGGNREPFVIYQEGANQYWGENHGK